MMWQMCKLDQRVIMRHRRSLVRAATVRKNQVRDHHEDLKCPGVDEEVEW
jgi:hypothetical protein